ncbi:hypothetical protein FHX15_003664 [Rhizobium sp. BK650]|uniref:hypothetical protein n=1 Tax=Rhizobium sp. BK650 TaxID=2586990 RepID=UPI0016104515|nr:hypothetical protein [Rhizobium sp. BK650]MBB3658417.1 hypothetical protein [Rhizobium sp. BK650]
MTDSHAAAEAVPCCSSNTAHLDMLEAISRRRGELADEMDGTGDVAKLSLKSSLDALLILTFDEACTGRFATSSFWGCKDELSRKMLLAVIERLQKEFLVNQGIVRAMGRGTMAAHGQLDVNKLWC